MVYMEISQQEPKTPALGVESFYNGKNILVSFHVGKPALISWMLNYVCVWVYACVCLWIILALE